ncbi:type II secretion system F family protein [Silicimonas sp. MF1-12-2]|uniref:type II secretion system F family protein n=1 Tax=Silicimonas sp. MF1-12-2 TaxID=3384793 RepID=UPI0039B47C5F
MFQEILQQIDLQFAVYVGAVVGGLLILEGLRQLVSRRGRTEDIRSRRMKMISKGATTEEILAILKPEEKRTFMNRLPLVGDLPRVLRQAGITMSSGAFLTTCFAGFVAVVVIFSQLMVLPTAVLVAFILCFFVPIMAVRLQRTQRVNDLIRQLPDALDMMARGLKVGHPLNASLAAVANEMPDPIGTEFGIVVDQVSYGDDLTDAFNEFADRINEEDLQYLATAIAIQHGTGGDLARILSVLSKVIRDRLTMRRKIKAISAEGRLSAAILSVVPVIIFVGLNVMSPAYYGDIADEPGAKPLVFIVVTLVLVNAVILRKLVTFRF